MAKHYKSLSSHPTLRQRRSRRDHGKSKHRRHNQWNFLYGMRAAMAGVSGVALTFMFALGVLHGYMGPNNKADTAEQPKINTAKKEQRPLASSQSLPETFSKDTKDIIRDLKRNQTSRSDKKTSQKKTYASSSKQASLKNILHEASDKTDIPFDLVVKIPGVESSYNQNAVNKESGACGLWQIVDGTMLELLKKHGHKHGYGHMAPYIQAKKTRSGYAWSVKKNAPSTIKNQIDKACFDPELSTYMALEYMKENLTSLEEKLDRPLNHTDAYFTHFLGPSGAKNFLSHYYKYPDKRYYRADKLVNKSAAAQNKSIFYIRYNSASNNVPRSIGQTYNVMARKVGTQKLPRFTEQQDKRVQLASNNYKR